METNDNGRQKFTCDARFIEGIVTFFFFFSLDFTSDWPAAERRRRRATPRGAASAAPASAAEAAAAACPSFRSCSAWPEEEKNTKNCFFKIRSLSIKNGKTWHSLLVDALDLVLVALRCEPIQDEPDEKENKIGTRTASTIRKTIQSTRESGFVFLVEPLARSSKDS